MQPLLLSGILGGEAFFRTFFHGFLGMTLLLALTIWGYRRLLRRRRKLRRIESLRALDALKSRHILQLARDFQAPLRELLELSGQFRPEKPVADRQKMLVGIRQHSVQMLSLVNRMLELERTELRRMQPVLIRGNIMGFIRDQCEIFAGKASTGNIGFSFQTIPDTLIMDFDAGLLTMVLSDLFSLALKFTRPGERIEVQAQYKEENLIIGISNTRPEDAAIAVDRSLGASVPTVGQPVLPVESDDFDLDQTRDLAQRLGGRIVVENEPGRRPVVSLWLSSVAALNPRGQSQSDLAEKNGTLTGKLKKQPLLLFSGEGDHQLNDVFLKEVFAEIETNIGNHDFTVSGLCQSLAMSKSQLHRKLKALTGQSANRLIRAVRLKKACHLLSDTDLNISEIAFQTGFSDPAYFSRLFNQEMGMSPSEYRDLSSGESAPLLD